MVTKVPQRIIASTGVTSGSYTNANITVNSGGQITSASSGTGGGASTDVPKISNLQVTNSTWTVLDDTAVDVVGGYILLTGVNFVSGCLVYIGQTPATSVAFVSSTTVRVTVPQITAGTYPVYLVNPDGGVAIRVPGVTLSASPAWQTASGLTDQYDATAISLQLLATDATSYSIASGSLPPGLTMNSSGLISGTVTGVAVDTTYTFSVVATDAQLQDSPRTFTLTITVSDPYFKLTTLLLTGNSGANIVTDASTNNFPITVAGDARASNFSPYLTGWSCYFDGTGDYLDIPTNAAFDFGTGDFTIECWAYLTTLSNSASGLITCMNVAGTNPSWLLGFSNTANQMAFLPSYFNTPVGFSYVNYYNKWTHIAVTRSGTALRLFADGVLVANSTDSTTISTGGKSIRIGSRYQNDSQYLINGYVSNLRIVKGTALYTANFTPATSTLTAVTNTSLLTCHANRLADSSTNNFAITRNGDVSVQSFNPFNLTNTGTTGSMYFDGTGDYLTILGNSSSFNLGTSNFTLEAWFYIPNLSGRKYIFGPGTDTASHYDGIGLEIWDNKVAAWASSNGTSWDIYECDTAGNRGSGTVIANMWNHIAYVRNVNNFAVYLNGVQQISFTSSAAIAYQTSNPYNIGRSAYSPDNFPFNGYISNLRLVKGTAVYTSNNFTLAGEPLTAIANTQLLTLQNRQPHNNHTFQDASSNNFLITRSGNATQGTFSPFSPHEWTVYFDGNSYLRTPSSGNLGIGTQDFTIECWYYAINNVSFAGSFVQQLSGDYGIIMSPQGFFYKRDNSYEFSCNAASLPPLNAWHHYAVSRSGTNVSLWIDGVRQNSVTILSSLNMFSTTIIIGDYALNSYRSYYNGYVKDFRFVIGSTVYNVASTTITVPTTKLPVVSGTQLLACQDNFFKDRSTNNFSLLNGTGSPRIQAFSPYAPTAVYSPVTYGGSAYFDGTGDYLSTAQNPLFNFGTTAFTVECWVYFNAFNSGDRPIGLGDGANGGSPVTYTGWSLTMPSSGTAVSWYRYDGTETNLSASYSFSKNTWYHIAVCRNGSNNLSIFVNGSRVYNNTSVSVSFNNVNSNSLYIGAVFDGSGGGASWKYLNGYVSNARIVNGAAIYDPTQTTITVPTAPLTATSTTSLLLNFTNDAIEDATGRNVIETVGDARTTSVITKWAGQTSMYFDGTGDYLKTVSNSVFNCGTGNWTIEAWVYINSETATYPVILGNNNATYATAGSLVFGNHNSDNASYNNKFIITGYDGSLRFADATTHPLNTWIHIAVVRDSLTSLKMFRDGNLVASKTDLSSTYTFDWGKNGLLVGGGNWDGAGSYYNGYIQDLRFARHARYTTNFTPPTSSLRLK